MDIQQISKGDYIVPSKDREYLSVTANKLYKITSVMKNADNKVYEVWFVNNDEKPMWVNVSQFNNKSWKIVPAITTQADEEMWPFTYNQYLSIIGLAIDLEIDDIRDEYITKMKKFEGDK